MKLIIIKYYNKNEYVINAKSIWRIDHIASTKDIDESIEIYHGKNSTNRIDIEDNPVIKNPFAIKCFNKDKTTRYDHTEVDNLSEIFNDIINFCTEKDSGVLVIEVKR